MKTVDEIRAKLPARLQKFEVLEPMGNLDDANQRAAYLFALLQEDMEHWPEFSLKFIEDFTSENS